MSELNQAFKKMRTLNKEGRGTTEWTEGSVYIMTPLSWNDNFESAINFATRQGIVGETRGNMGVIRVQGGGFAICHLDTGTIVKQIDANDIEEAKVEAERYGEIFKELADPLLSFEHVQGVIKQSLMLDDLREKDPDSLIMEIN